VSAVDAVVLLAYATLLLELVVFPIPSEASTLQLLRAARTADAAPAADSLAVTRTWSPGRKLLLLFLPTAIGVLAFLVPPLAILVPAVGEFVPVVERLPFVVLGVLLIAVGRTLTFVSVLQLRAWRRRRDGSGDRNGLFAWSRNPGLCGMFVFYSGLCVLYPHPCLWLVLPLYVANMNHRVSMEEAHLLATHGDAWRDYARVVPRYFGRMP
jgi:protein-S-isoprenylcysteine O-methyltransferase Ste14